MTAPTLDKTDPTPAAAPKRRRRRDRLQTLRRGDKAVAAVMLGIPLLLAAAFVWLPAIGSILLSFTKWTGVGSIKMQSCANFPTAPGIPQPGCLYGVQNYKQAFTSYPVDLAAYRGVTPALLIRLRARDGVLEDA